MEIVRPDPDNKRQMSPLRAAMIAGSLWLAGMWMLGIALAWKLA